VYSSVASAHRRTGIPHFDNKWRVEDTVRSLAFPSYAIIRPVFFMENLASPWFKPAIDGGKLVMAIAPTTVLQMIAVADIGKYLALAFEQHQKMNGRALDIAGDALTIPDAARVLSEVAGRPIVFEHQPIEQIRSFSEDHAIMLEWFDRVGYDVDIAALSREFGITPTGFREWAGAVDWSPQPAAAK